MMRSVSFVERLELEFTGNLLQNSLVLGDADNDGFNELLMGTASGELYIFKGKHTKPWMVSSGLGMITCIGVSDILNTGRNSVIVLSSEGWCYIFNLSKPQVNEVRIKELSRQDKTGQILLSYCCDSTDAPGQGPYIGEMYTVY